MRISFLAFLWLGVSISGLGAQPPDGKTYFWFRMWPDFLVKYDVATDQVVGKIQNQHGVAHGTILSHDRTRFFTITGKRTFVEVVDIAKMEIIEEHSFEETGKIIRVSTVKEIPGGTHWYVKIDRVKMELDHYVIEKPEWLHYHVAEKKIEKRMKDLPRAIRRGARISPCGTKWHVFGRDLTIVDPTTLEEEGKIELSRPLYSGMGPISVRSDDFFDGRNHGAYRMIYTMRDPIRKNRSLMGLFDLNLETHQIENLREWGHAPRVRGWRLTADRKLAVGQKSSRERRRQYDGEDPELTLVTYDLESGRKMRETRLEVRNGLRLAGVSPDGKKIYLTGRGHEIVIYDDNHEYVKTVELEGEFEGGFTALVE